MFCPGKPWGMYFFQNLNSMLKIIPHNKFRRITTLLNWVYCLLFLISILVVTANLSYDTKYLLRFLKSKLLQVKQWDKYTSFTAHAATRCIYFWDFKVICEIQGFSTFYGGWQIHNPCCIEKPYKMSIVMSLDGCTFLCYQSCLMSYQTVVYIYIGLSFWFTWNKWYKNKPLTLPEILNRGLPSLTDFSSYPVWSADLLCSADRWQISWWQSEFKPSYNLSCGNMNHATDSHSIESQTCHSVHLSLHHLSLKKKLL